jgi:hypothetical protein
MATSIPPSLVRRRRRSSSSSVLPEFTTATEGTPAAAKYAEEECAADACGESDDEGEMLVDP